MWRISIVLLLCLLAGQANSNPPSPAPSKASHQPEANPKHNDEHPATDQRGTENSPVFIKVIPPLTVEPQAAKEADNHRDYTSPEWWLVYITGALVVFTGGLMIYTARLWGATKELAEDARRVADRQAREMQDSLRIAEKSAGAAEQSAEVANKSLPITQRAYAFGKGFIGAPNIVDDGIKTAVIKEYVFWVDWENVGNTPATHGESWINVQTFPKSIRQEPMFQKNAETESSFVLGPHAKCKSAFHTIPLATMIDSWSNQTSIYIWAKIEYRDIFNPGIIHYHEQCSLISLLHEPSTIPPERSISYLRFGAYGPQNGTG